jgi:hypothetical protein
MAIIPALTVVIGYQRALLINAGITLPVTLATAIEALGIFSILAVLVLYSALPGIISAALAYLLGRVLAMLYLSLPCSGLASRKPSAVSKIERDIHAGE